MTDHVARLYVLAVTVLGLFVVWAVLAAHPWKSTAAAPAASPAEARLATVEQRLAAVARLTDTLARARAERVAGTTGATVALPPRIVTLPPVTVTRTS
jgi:hypothetical protein